MGHAPSQQKGALGVPLGPLRRLLFKLLGTFKAKSSHPASGSGQRATTNEEKWEVHRGVDGRVESIEIHRVATDTKPDEPSGESSK